MAFDPITLALSKGYTKEILEGSGAIQGKPGPKGDPGDTPYIGENGNWWIGGNDTGAYAEGTTDHRELSERDAEGQHPIQSIIGLEEELNRIPEPVEALTNSELEEILQ